MSANDSSSGRQNRQDGSRKAPVYQTMRPRGWDCTDDLVADACSTVPTPKVPGADRNSSGVGATILPPPISTQPEDNVSHDTESPEAGEELTDTVAYHTTASRWEDESDTPPAATPPSHGLTWVGDSDGLQVRRCTVGGTITGVPQVVVHSIAAKGKTNVEYSILGIVGKGGMGVVR